MQLFGVRVPTALTVLVLLTCNTFGMVLQIENSNWKTVRRWDWGPSKEFTVNGGVDDIVAFFGTDTDRPLEYTCANTTALCGMHITKSQPDPKKKEVVVSAQLTDLVLPDVSMAGLLQLCIGPSHLFRKQPFVRESEVSCHAWHVHKDSEPQPGGFKVYPNYEVQESAVLAVYTWYMTIENYQEMRRDDITQVIVPLFKEPYNLPLYAILFTPYATRERVKCSFQTPSHSSNDLKTMKQRHVSKELGPHTYKFSDSIKTNSGVYTVTCPVLPGRIAKSNVSKSLNITFISGPMIVVRGYDDHRVVFAPQDTTGSFIIHVYTTTPPTSFDLERSDGVTSSESVLSELVSYSLYGIVAEYSVSLPWLKEEVTGMYTVSFTNKDKESATENIEIMKAKALQLLVTPAQQAVGVGARVTFECLVLGNLLEEVTWSRDFEELDQDKYAVEIKEFGDSGHRGLRLTFLNPQLEDSGHYVCKAWNQFESLADIVELVVRPVVQGNRRNDGPNILNISDAELEEWGEKNNLAISWGRKKSGSSASTVAGILCILILLAMGGGGAGVYIWMKYYRTGSTKRGKGKQHSHSQALESTSYKQLQQEDKESVSGGDEKGTNSDTALIEDFSIDIEPNLSNKRLSEGNSNTEGSPEEIPQNNVETVLVPLSEEREAPPEDVPLEGNLISVAECEERLQEERISERIYEESDSDIDETVPLLAAESGEKERQKRRRKNKDEKTKDKRPKEDKKLTTPEKETPKRDRTSKKDRTPKEKKTPSTPKRERRQKEDEIPCTPEKDETSSTPKRDRTPNKERTPIAKEKTPKEEKSPSKSEKEERKRKRRVKS